MVSLLSGATMKILRLPLPVSCAFALRSALDTPVAFFFLAAVSGKLARAALDLGKPV
jgi:hypothetical protein